MKIRIGQTVKVTGQGITYLVAISGIDSQGIHGTYEVPADSYKSAGVGVFEWSGYTFEEYTKPPAPVTKIGQPEYSSNAARELMRAFTWGNSEEGHKFWERVHERLIQIGRDGIIKGSGVGIREGK